MDWRSAFLEQARDDFRVFELLNTTRLPYSHQLHYFQMLSEKLAKAILLAPESSNPPAPSHAVLVRMLQVIKTRPNVIRELGFQETPRAFREMVDRLLPLAHEIEQLAPALAGFSRPNPEYPWYDQPSGTVVCPMQYNFTGIDLYRPPMLSLLKCVQKLLFMRW